MLKYAEPPEARKPVRNWRLYVFKGKEQVGALALFGSLCSGLRASTPPAILITRRATCAELFHVHRQSCYLFGRDRIVRRAAPSHRPAVPDPAH